MSGYVNVINQDVIIKHLTRGLEERMGQTFSIWARKAILRALLEVSTHYSAVRYLELNSLLVVTAREAMLMKHFSKKTKCYIATPQDYADMAWLKPRMDEGQQLVFLEESEHGDHTGGLQHQVLHLCEAIAEYVPDRASYDSISWKRALEYASDWSKKMQKQKDTTEGFITTVFEKEATDVQRHGDGTRTVTQVRWEVVELKDAQALKREGVVMHHCVGGGSYANDLRKGARFFSLRIDGRSVTTLHIEPKEHYTSHTLGPRERTKHAQWITEANPEGYAYTLVQMRGVTNTNLTDQMKAVMLEFFLLEFPMLAANAKEDKPYFNGLAGAGAIAFPGSRGSNPSVADYWGTNSTSALLEKRIRGINEGLAMLKT